MGILSTPFRTTVARGIASGTIQLGRSWSALVGAAGVLATSSGVFAQIVPVPTFDGAALASALRPTGLTITSVTVVRGTAAQIGTYTNFSQPPVVFPDGVMLSSGSIAAALPGASPAFSTGSGTSPELHEYATTTGAILNYLGNFDASVIEVHFTLDAPGNIKFDFVFGSIEYPVYVGQFTDTFVAFLDGLGAANQICFDAKGNAVQVGQSFANRVTTADVNTAFGGSHGLIEPLTTTTPLLAAGEHVLRFEVADTNDSTLDSAVFITNLRAESGQAGTEPTPFTLQLIATSESLAPGSTFTVRACSTPPSAPMSGAQMALHFDASRLRLEAVTPVGTSPLGSELAEQIDNSAGTLRYALGLADLGVPLTGAADLCDLTFSVLPGAGLCDVAGLVTFGPVGPFTTRFTQETDAAPVVPELADLAPINLDSVPPVLSGVPADISVPTDAGSTFGALVSLPTVTALDDCDGPVAVTTTGIPAGGIFPIGTTTVTWTATDAAGNTATASRTVTVEPYQLLDAVVSISSPQLGASHHALRIGAGAAVQVVDTLIPAWSGATPSSATVTVHVPVASSYPCVSAKSVGATVAGGAVRASHTLTDTASASVSGSRYRAEFVLLSGDSNDDDMVEILDYGNWVVDRSTPGNSVRAPEARSNYNGDGLVIQGDVGLIVAYFFRVGESCTPGADAPRHPRERITVKELRRTGRGELAAADLNHDGWVDTRDMQMAVQGGGAQGAAIPREAGGVAW